MDNLIIKYVSLQDTVLATFNDLHNAANDFTTNSTRFSSILSRFRQHQQSFRDLKLTLNNNKSLAATRNSLLDSIYDDEKTINEAVEILKQIINSPITRTKTADVTSTTATTETFAGLYATAAPTTTNEYNYIKFIDVMREYVGEARAAELLYSQNLNEEDFKYQVEFDIILKKHVDNITLFRNTDLNRVDCLIIITQAFFLNNIRDLDFAEIKQNDTPIKREKLICLFTYFITMFEYIRNTNSSLHEPIIIQHNQATFEDIELIRTTNKSVDPSKVNIEEFTAIHKYFKHRTFKSYDLILDYAEKKIGLHSLTDSANYEDIMFMKYPELYGVAYLVNKHNTKVFGDYDSYLLSNIIQFNIVENARYQSKHVNSAANLFGVINVNIVAFESCDLKAHLGSMQSDKTHLDRMILKLYSGLLHNRNTRRFNNNVEDEKDAVIRLHAGTGINDCTENKTFQFLIELLVCSVLNYQLCYCVRNFEQLCELNDTLEAMGRMNVAELYFKLVNYDFKATGPFNFKSTQSSA